MTLDERLSVFLDDGWYKEHLGATRSYRYHTEDSQRSKGDIRLEIRGKGFNLEEKANAQETSDCLLELIQAIEDPWDNRKTRGWFFDLHECDFLLHGYFGVKDGESPMCIRILAWKTLREKVFQLIRSGTRPRIGWNPSPPNPGYGITLCMFVPYNLLEDCKYYEWHEGEPPKDHVDSLTASVNAFWKEQGWA